ncbi:hypothetical protein NONI108955_20445 [Nocardia ninae]|uniref:Uncharacterized protein n=1 Tax=Nocardia ninae NBRC 108245 TaxID=1210091 RepID=A0A511MCC6_9NOCA|nr:hypothetical protein [Nocardia ninae]GEM38334.1 hypothetical protein NN4_28530 [Nocardia ninae NBRC 108245]
MRLGDRLVGALLVGQFDARDAEGRVYPINEYQHAVSVPGSPPIMSFELATGEQVKHLGGDLFEVVPTGVEITRVP